MVQPDGRGATGDDLPEGLPDRTTDEDAVLTGSLEALANLSVGSMDLTDMLTKVATLAVRAIPGADGAGLTLLEIDRADLIVKSEPFVRPSTISSTASVKVPVSARRPPVRHDAPADSATTHDGECSVRGPANWACTAPCHCRWWSPPGFWVRSTSTRTPWTPSTTTPRSAARHSPCQRP